MCKGRNVRICYFFLSWEAYFCSFGQTLIFREKCPRDKEHSIKKAILNSHGHFYNGMGLILAQLEILHFEVID